MRLPAACLLAAAILAGCQSPAPSPGLGDPWLPPGNDPQISVLSPELQPWLRFQPARIDQQPGGPMQIEVPLRNIAARQYLIDYRFLFYDEKDMETGPSMGWRFIAINPKQIVRLKAGALGPEAMSYRLEIKWAQ
jgi:uncharacterized protein YcfL